MSYNNNNKKEDFIPTLGKACFRSKVYRLKNIQNVGEPGFVYIPSLVLEGKKGKTLKDQNLQGTQKGTMCSAHRLQADDLID